MSLSQTQYTPQFAQAVAYVAENYDISFNNISVNDASLNNITVNDIIYTNQFNEQPNSTTGFYFLGGGGNDILPLENGNNGLAILWNTSGGGGESVFVNMAQGGDLSSSGFKFYTSDISANSTLIGEISEGNIVLGYNAGNEGQTAQNISIGNDAGNNMVSGSTTNVSIGFKAGQSITTGSNNICIGTQASCLTTGSNNILMGYNAVSTTSGALVLNPTSSTVSATAAGVYIAGVTNLSSAGPTLQIDPTTHKITYYTSSIVFKNTVEPFPDTVSNAIYQIIPKKYIENSNNKTYYGCIAESIAQTDAGDVFIYRDASGNVEGINQTPILFSLIQEIQKLRARVDALDGNSPTFINNNIIDVLSVSQIPETGVNPVNPVSDTVEKMNETQLEALTDEQKSQLDTADQNFISQTIEEFKAEEEAAAAEKAHKLLQYQAMTPAQQAALTPAQLAFFGI